MGVRLSTANRGPALAFGGWRWLGVVLRLLAGGRCSPSDASCVAELRLHLSQLSGTELADYGLRREQIGAFVEGGRIEPR